MTALYALTGQYAQLMHQLDSLDLDAVTIADTIEASGIVDEIGAKAQGLIYVARAAVQYLPALDAEIIRLQALKSRRLAIEEEVLDYLKANMETMGIEKIECPFFKIVIAKNPQSVEVLDALAVPDEYLAEQKPAPPRAPDKKKIGDALKAGADLSWAKLNQSTRLKIT